MRRLLKLKKWHFGLIAGLIVALAGPVGLAVGVYSHPHRVPGGSISGVVTDTRGRGAAVCVSAYTMGGHVRANAVSDATSGQYRIAGLIDADYKLLFLDCDRNYSEYRLQWFSGAAGFDAATPVTVGGPFETTGIDVTMSFLPAPDLGVTGMKVTKDKLQTDYGNLVSAGWTRTVTVSFTNFGDLGTDHASLDVWASGNTGGDREIGAGTISLGSGESAQRSYEWNGFGSIGDFTVHALVCAPRDFNPANDEGETPGYVLVGGTGFGLAPSVFGSGHGCYYGVIYRP